MYAALSYLIIIWWVLTKFVSLSNFYSNKHEMKMMQMQFEKYAGICLHYDRYRQTVGQTSC